MNITDRINSLAKLGDILRNPDADKFQSFRKEIEKLDMLISESWKYNAWFTPENVSFAIYSIGESLKQHRIEKWFNKYPERVFENNKPLTIGVVMAGNIPMVGFHDYISVVVTGNKFLGKLSGDDKELIPLIHKILEKIEPEFTGKADFTEERLSDFDAVIATGSNNTSRYFEYYFGKYPHIIRKNRNGVAVLDGSETDEQLEALGEDIFRYFGLGCRNVSKIYFPRDFSVERFIDNLAAFSTVIDHHKYKNNYDYNKSILLINGTPHLDNGFLLLKEDEALASPVSVLHYEFYDDAATLNNQLLVMQEQIQCIVGNDKNFQDAIPPGTSQKPQLWEYADNIDTIKFLMDLK